MDPLTLSLLSLAGGTLLGIGNAAGAAHQKDVENNQNAVTQMYASRTGFKPSGPVGVSNPWGSVIGGATGGLLQGGMLSKYLGQGGDPLAGIKSPDYSILTTPPSTGPWSLGVTS